MPAYAGDESPLYSPVLEEFNKEAHIRTECRIHLARLGDALVLSIVGIADKSGYQFLAEKAVAIVNGEEAKGLIIDLTHCEKLSSSPLGMLGLVLMAFDRKGGRVSIITTSPAIIQSLKILGLTERCRIVASAADIEA